MSNGVETLRDVKLRASLGKGLISEFLAFSALEKPQHSLGLSNALRHSRFSLSALSTTETLEKAMAVPPSIGLSNPRAATGIRSTL